MKGRVLTVKYLFDRVFTIHYAKGEETGLIHLMAVRDACGRQVSKEMAFGVIHEAQLPQEDKIAMLKHAEWKHW